MISPLKRNSKTEFLRVVRRKDREDKDVQNIFNYQQISKMFLNGDARWSQCYLIGKTFAIIRTSCFEYAVMKITALPSSV